LRLEYDRYFQHASTDVGERGRISGEEELYHLAGAFLNNAWKKGVNANNNAIKEENVRWIFDQLGSYFNSVLGPRAKHSFRTNWQHRILVHIKSERKKYSYNPRSDFYISVDGLCRLLVEVQSDKDESDRYRMLLHAACVARLGRRLLKGDSFIVVALYVENTGSVTRYLVFQPDVADRKVFYVKDVQDWKQPRGLFAALFELYNLLSTISEDRPALVDTEDTIKALDDDLGDNFNDTFMSERTYDGAHEDAHEDESKPAKRSRGSHGGRGGKASKRSNCGEYVYEDHQVLSAFTRAGVTLMSNDGDAYGLMPLDRVKWPIILSVDLN